MSQSHENPEAPQHSIAESLISLSIRQKLGRMASVALLLNPLAGLANHGESAPAPVRSDVSVVNVEEQPTSILTEAPGAMVTNEVQHSSNDSEHQPMQDMPDQTTEYHVEAGDPELANELSGMLAQDKPYGVYGKNPGDDVTTPAAPMAPHTGYGPVMHPEKLQRIA